MQFYRNFLLNLFKYTDNDPFVIDTVGTPTNGGSVTYNDDTVTYTPSSDTCDKVAPDATYTDTIPYTIVDADGLTSNTAIITVTVYCDRNPPNAKDDEATTDEDSPVTVPVLNNDSDPDNDPISVVEVTSPPSYGTADPQPDDTIKYTPNKSAKDKCDKIYPRTVFLIQKI